MSDQPIYVLDMHGSTEGFRLEWNRTTRTFSVQMCHEGVQFHCQTFKAVDPQGPEGLLTSAWSAATAIRADHTTETPRNCFVDPHADAPTLGLRLYFDLADESSSEQVLTYLYATCPDCSEDLAEVCVLTTIDEMEEAVEGLDDIFLRYW